jgi:sugar phosphate isomerase/epimerase
MTARSRDELERAIRALGVRCTIEAHDALALALPDPGERGFENDEVRRRAIDLARAHGFSHLAVELPKIVDNAPDRATLPGH